MRLLETPHTLTPRSDWLAQRAGKARNWSNIKPEKIVLFFPVGHSVTVSASGRLCNLGCATGQCSSLMSCFFHETSAVAVSRSK